MTAVRSGNVPPAVGPEALFEQFVARHGRPLRIALTARYGADVGADVTADVLGLAWERWSDVSVMANPAGYLFRAGQSAARRYRRRPVTLPFAPQATPPEFDPRLPRLVEQLPDRQRVAVVLTCIDDQTHASAAALMGISESSLRTHLRRGLATLRRGLEKTP